MKKLLAVLVLAASTVGCGDSSGLDAGANINGTYTLRTINGQNLPYPVVVVGTTYRLEVTAAQIVINSNGTYNESATRRETQGTTTTTQTDASSGSWTRVNNAITFVQTSDGATVLASLSSDTITLVDGELTFVYRR